MSTVSEDLTIKVHKTDKEFKALKNSWNKLIHISGSDVFQLHEWQKSWWDIFGSNNDLQIITYWLEDELIAILPFFIHEKKFDRFRFVKTLQLIGSHITTADGGILPVDKAFGGYLDIIVHPDYFRLISQELPDLFEELIQMVDEISLDELPVRSLLMQCLPCLEESDNWTLKKSEASACSQCLISSDWDRYLSTLSRSTRKNIRRGLRSVYDDEVFEIKEAKTADEFERIFDELVHLHQNRWNQLNMPGVFADNRVEKFYRSTSLNLFNDDLASIHWAEDNNQIFAVELCYHYNHTTYTLQTGFDADSEYSKYSPGNLIIYHIMKTGVEKGYLVFDWLRGSQDYKSSTSNLLLQNQKLTLTAKNKLSGFKLSLSDASTKVLTKLKSERMLVSMYFKKYSFMSALRKNISRALSHARNI